MATTTIRRCRIIGTGVAGSPYYLNGYFDANVGSATQCLDAWMLFSIGVVSGTTAGMPSGSTWTGESTVTLINPATGQATGTETATSRVATGTSSGPFLPPANQFLVRWHTGVYVAGREVRGRTNLPCPQEASSTTTGQVEPTAITAIDGRASTLMTDANQSFVVWSKKNGVWHSATSASTWANFSILRSRRD